MPARDRSASSFELTDDERALRDLAYPLIEPPYDRQQWYSVAGEYGLYRPIRGPAFDRTAYAMRSAGGRRPLAVGALCAAERRCPQRHHALAAILRNRHARARYRPEAAKEPGLCLRTVARRAQKRRAAHARECVDRRIGARKTGCSASRPIVMRSSAWSSRRRRRRRSRSSAPSINCKLRSRATAPPRRPGCASRTWPTVR